GSERGWPPLPISGGLRPTWIGSGRQPRSSDRSRSTRAQNDRPPILRMVRRALALGLRPEHLAVAMRALDAEVEVQSQPLSGLRFVALDQARGQQALHGVAIVVAHRRAAD